MFVCVFVANMPDNCGAFFSDITLAKALRKRGHQVLLINCANPRQNYAGGEYEGLSWKPYVSAGRELDQSQIWVAPHFPIAPLVRKLNSNYQRPIIFTLHFPGAPKMFEFPGRIGWKEMFWYVNSAIPHVLLPQGFPSQVSQHELRHPFVDEELVRVSEPGRGTYITLINANANKGLVLFTEIARRMPDTKFLAVRSYYHHAFGYSLDIPPNITWIDFSRDMRSLYEKTRILLVPSAYESFCMVAVEAMSNGIPVLYTRPNDLRILYDYGSTEGMAEWIEPAGIACDIQKAEDWVEQLRALEDPEIYAERSQQVREHVRPILHGAERAVVAVEAFSQANPIATGKAFTIQAGAPKRQETATPLTAIPQAPSGQKIGWQNGRLSFGRR